MTEVQNRLFKIALVLNPSLGAGSFSWRCKEALESCGHTVFCFSPRLQPWLFDEDGCLNMQSLEKFLEVQNIDFIVFADKTLPTSRPASPKTAVGLLCDGAERIEANEEAFRGLNLDFAIATDNQVLRFIEDKHLARFSLYCPPLVDRGYRETPVANTIAFKKGIICLQDATPERISILQEVISHSLLQERPVRCFGKGWPTEWSVDCTDSVSSTAFVYASRFSNSCIVFNEPHSSGDGYLSDSALAVIISDGCKVIAVRSDSYQTNRNEEVTYVTDAASAIEGLTHTATLDDLPASVKGAFLEDVLPDLFMQLSNSMLSDGMAQGSPSSRLIVTILGYFGMGNFGDEYILQTINSRLRTWHEGASVIAISENPEYTLIHRGIYAIALKDKASVDRTLSFSSAALVVAGLLFDQGIRWAMGKAELVSSLHHSDIPGIAAYVLLASMNDARPVFYGIGAGPLNVPDSKSLVSLMGKIGALFVTRDEDTAGLISSCGVDADQVIPKADIAFLGTTERTKIVDDWLIESEIDMSSHRLCAVSLREYENLPSDFAERVARAFDCYATTYPDTCFVFCILDPEDKTLAESIISAMQYTDSAFILDPEGHIEVIADILSRSHMGFSMRYHCSLLLNSFGKPCVGLDYLPKVASLYHDMGCDELLLPITAASDDMSAALAKLTDHYGEWVSKINRNVSRLRKLSEEAEKLLYAQIEEGAASKEGRINQTFFMRNIAASDVEAEQIHKEDVELIHRLTDDRYELERTQDELSRTQAELSRVLSSRTYRVGDTIMRFPRFCKKTLRGLKLKSTD